MGPWPYLCAVWLAVVGLWGVVTSRHLVHLVGCLLLVQSATYVLLVAVGYRVDATAPVRDEYGASVAVVDPVVQALALTDIVVGAVQVALLLVLAIQAQRRFGTLDPDRIRELRG